jgi:hypothetical protein
MGRDGVMRDLCILTEIYQSSYNIMIVRILFSGCHIANYQECANLINFGAFRLHGCKPCSHERILFKSPEKTARGFWSNCVPPAIGFLFCLIIWLNLPLKTFIIGGSWMMAGIIYLAIKSKGFRENPVLIDFSQ